MFLLNCVRKWEIVGRFTIIINEHVNLRLYSIRNAQRRIQDRRTGRARPPVENLLGLVFVNLDSITRIFFHCSEHAALTISILSSILITKTWNMCERASKHSQTPRILPRRDRAPGFENPGSATDACTCNLLINYIETNMKVNKGGWLPLYTKITENLYPFQFSD